MLLMLVGCAHAPPRLDPHCVDARPVSVAAGPEQLGVLRDHMIGSVAITGADPALAATLRRVRDR